MFLNQQGVASGMIQDSPVARGRLGERSVVAIIFRQIKIIACSGCLAVAQCPIGVNP